MVGIILGKIWLVSDGIVDIKFDRSGRAKMFSSLNIKELKFYLPRTFQINHCKNRLLFLTAEWLP